MEIDNESGNAGRQPRTVPYRGLYPTESASTLPIRQASQTEIMARALVCMLPYQDCDGFGLKHSS